MFTGIIEELGVVTSFIRGSRAGKLTISVSPAFADMKAGESVAVNGACLTVTAIRRSFIEFDISAETLKRSNLAELKVGEKANLEKALPVNGRLGGHMVTGHVDGVGQVRQRTTAEMGFELQVSVPGELMKYLVPKGSIALDGVSLTIAELREGLVVVSVVPHTARSTNLGSRNAGDRVNVEVDVLSKYIERHVRGEPRGITEDTLMRVGYLPMGYTEN